MDKKLELEGSFSGVVNFAMQQNYVPIVRNLIIKNNSSEDIKDIDITITVEPDFAYEWKVRVENIRSEQSVELDSINIKLSPNFLYSLTEKMAGTIFINIKQGEEVLESVTQNIDILAYDEWSGTLIMPEIISAFITPNHQKVTEIIIKANKILEKWCGSPSFVGYQSNNPNTVRMQMAAIYTALQNENIAYCMPPASYEIIGQRVRLCDEVLAQKLGTCLDLSLLYASCLEAVGLFPMIIFLRGHAFVGCWLEGQCFAECVQDDVSLITKRIAEGINEICLVECTCFVAGKKIDFDAAVKSGENDITSSYDFELLVDIKRTRGSGIRPIPLRKKAGEGNGFYEDVDFSAEENSMNASIGHSPKEIETFEKINYVDHVDITRQQLWERKLLDLSLRNTLINFRVTKNSIQLMASQLGELEDALSSGEEFSIMARPKDMQNTLRDSKIYEAENQTSIVDNLINTEFKNKRLRTFADEKEVDYRIKGLYRQAKLSLEENGANTLYLALGFLKWYESDVSERERYAPIVLIPIEIVRKSVQKGYVIRIREEDPQVNITLLEMLRQDFGLTIGGLDPLPTDDSGIDLKRVFNIFRQAVMDKSRWDVEELAFIGLFSFSQFIMWNDIRNRSEDLKKNKIVASLLSQKMEWKPTDDFPEPNTLDDTFKPMDLAVPISADSSQLSAISASGKDNSFVLHGPPGTGKSQTITNIIANALYQGKSVLFIAEKIAALSVVQKRLEAIGLGRFCLELHSNKAKKKDVLDQLDQCLNATKVKAPEVYEEQAKRLYDLRKELNEVVNSIHKKQDFGWSLYEAISCFEQYRDYADSVRFTEEQVSKVTPDIYTQWVDILGQYKVAGEECKGAYNNPLIEFTNSSYSQGVKSEINELLKKYAEAVIDLTKSNTEVTKLIGLNEVGKYDKVKALINLTQIINNSDYIPAKLFASEELALLKDKVDKVCGCGKKRDDIEKQLLDLFTKAILSFDEESALNQWKIAEDSWFLPKLMGQNKIAKVLKAMANNAKEFDKNNIPSYLKLIGEYKSNQKVVDENSKLFNELLGMLWNDGKADWSVISKGYSDAVCINDLLSGIADSISEKQKAKVKLAGEVFIDLKDFKQRNGDILRKAISNFEALSILEEKISQKSGIDFNALKSKEQWLKNAGEKAKLWLDNLDGLRNWCTYLSIKDKVKKAGLENVVAAYESGSFKEAEMLPVFYKGISQALAIYIVDKEKALSDFTGAIFEETISKYKETSAYFESLTKEELIARLSAKIPVVSGNVANSSEIGILQKAIRSGGRMLSIRKLFDSIPNLLRKLCPCMLMSPISVAQYIDPKYPAFDLVVFDEASQMPTCEAVGAMARGNNVIVVGDPKQLPPTSFFSTNRLDEDNYEQEDLESILDDCLALSMPQQHLLWHYRSSHESLIAFSNMQYYDNKLFTFPSPNDLVSAVKYIPVKGYYDRGKTKQNRAEAEAIVSEIERRLKDPVLRKLSMGVVTFSSVQQNLIDDLLVELFAKNTELEKINNEASESIFVKNLENVQGDERDVILFSIGYGPDEEGKVALNFGPLNREGGARRLNVAVSRARKEMMVFSTLRPEMLDLSKTRAQGVAQLKAFLEFAKNGKNSLPSKVSNASSIKHNNIERLIAEKIKTLGYEVHTNIGASEYKIDIAIVNPNKKGQYILGIMCDGNNYKAANTSRDRNILQGSVLKSLGWNIHRLWILDWWDNQGKEFNKIKLAVENAIEADGKKQTVEAIKDSNASEETIKNQASNAYANYDLNKTNESTAKSKEDNKAFIDEHNEKYLACTLESINLGAEEFYSSQNNKLIISQIEQVLKEEAPISKSLLCKRILASWGITRMGARLDRRFEDLFLIMSLTKTQSNNISFYWSSDNGPSEFIAFRVPAEDKTRRNMEDIPAEEISNAIRYILQNQISLLKSDLIREVWKLFGFSRGSASIDSIINEGIAMAVKRNFVKIDDMDRVVMVE
ncbi:DUF3320 domain-containing protein [Clostridium sp. C8-1-8]|uniref:DUF3320 domain-containing protein n=1 Tax=Clostridium sp. C8-1-8 TaxID=2698831 RepID=UPI00136E5799|nr:DUF3320 domain-containing protein [Clostridium sp. C8-1-8]